MVIGVTCLFVHRHRNNTDVFCATQGNRALQNLSHAKNAKLTPFPHATISFSTKSNSTYTRYAFQPFRFKIASKMQKGSSRLFMRSDIYTVYEPSQKPLISLADPHIQKCAPLLMGIVVFPKLRTFIH